MIAAALSFGFPSYASQYSLAGCDSVLNVMDFKHFSPLHVAPCFSMMAFTCCSLNAFPLKNRPSEMMLPGLKSYFVCNCSCEATASSTCTRQPMNRTNPMINASAAIMATVVSPTMRMRFLVFAFSRRYGVWRSLAGCFSWVCGCFLLWWLFCVSSRVIVSRLAYRLFDD